MAVVVCVVPVSGCKGTKDGQKVAAGPAASVSDAAALTSTSEFTPAGAFARDVQRICDATARSGALEQEEAYRAVTVAQWLAQNIESQDGRDLLARVARLAPKGKVTELRAAAAKIGLPDCATAAAWTGGSP